VHGELRYAVGELPATEVPDLVGRTNCEWGSGECTPCVRDVVASFNRIHHHGDILGFHLGDHPDPKFEIWDCVMGGPNCQHWQGVQRFSTYIGDPQESRGYDWLVVSRNGIDDGSWHWSGFAVVFTNSRSDLGERLRSNRFLWHEDFDDSPPDLESTITHTELINSEMDHRGSIQMVGNILVVGIDGDGNNGTAMRYAEVNGGNTRT
jgi:hypothetical protein